MTIASGINTVVAYKKETTPGTLAGATGGKQLRRVTCTLDMNKDTYESNEKVAHAQVSDFRHGVRRIGGALDGELSPGSYADLLAAAVRQDFPTAATATLDDVTAAATAPGTFTTAAGDWLAEGFKLGDVVRFTGWTTGTANNSRNYRITGLTATVMTVGTATTGAVGQPEAVLAVSAGDTVTVALVGKRTFMPTVLGDQTADAFTFEKWFSDIAQSEQFVGVRIGSVRISLPATGMATISFGLIGKDGVYGTTQYFTTPAATSTTGITAAVNGFLRVAGADVALVTGLEVTIDLGVGGEPVVGSNVIPSLFYGRSRVSGSFTAFFEDAALRTLFVNETEAEIAVVLTTDNTITADFLSVVMHRVKVGGAAKGDGDQGIVQTLPFTALLNVDGGSGLNTELTTISIQDSDAP